MKLTRADVRADFQALVRRITEGPGHVPAARRAAIAAGARVAGALGEYLEVVRQRAYDVTDAQVDGLRGAGLSDDEVFEVTVAAALGAARTRLDAGLGAVAAVYDET